MSLEVRLSAPAKINLCLGVGAVRADGYHPLATVYQAIGLYDEVTVRAGQRPRLTVSGEGVDTAEVPTDEGNLAWRAVELLAAHHGRNLGVSMHIRKRIPVAGGLAGGSADAAAALVGTDALFGLNTPHPELMKIAAELGSDVPFCVEGGTAMGAGRGELVTPVMARGEYWWVVVADGGGLPTSAVYERFDRLHGGDVSEPEVPDELLAALRAGDPHRLGAALTNDLEPAALSLRPHLAQLLACGREASAHGALVSGSGPTTVFLCESPAHAEHVDQHLQRESGTPPAILARGPVPGARSSGGLR